MRLYAFADEASPSVDGQVRALQRNSLDGLEIRGVDGENVADISAAKARETIDKLESAGLSIWSVGSPIGKVDIQSDFAQERERLKRIFETAHILKAGRIRVFSFYIPKGDDPAAYQNEVINRMGSFCEMAKAEEILLCHENEKGIFGDSAARCKALLDAVQPLGCVFDPANFIQCGEDVLSAFSLLKERISYLHIKDAERDGSVVPAGCGCGQLSKILEECRARGIDHATIEPHLTVFSGLDGLERAGEETKRKFVYPDAESAFDAACAAVKNLL